MSNSSNDPSLKVRQARNWLVIHEPFWGSLAMNLTITEKKGLQTYATDGKHFFYDPECVLKDKINHICFVWRHEICHVIMSHIGRQEHRNKMINLNGQTHRLWNVAAD